MVDPLQNPVWHALGGPQAVFAEAKGRARRFHPDVSVFGALPDTPDADDWDALRVLVGASESAFLIRGSIAVPDDWIATFELPCVQMVLEAEITPGPVPEHIALGTADVPEMTDLVTRTEPGPWRPRTVEFGGYVGVRDRGALVAMAGERMRLPGFTEVSVVCTEPDYRGRGLAGGLTRVRGGRHRGARRLSDAARVRAQRARCDCTSRSASGRAARWSRWRCACPSSYFNGSGSTRPRGWTCGCRRRDPSASCS